MYSITTEYLNQLSFTAEQMKTLRLLGEYRGKQELFFRQSPKTLNSLSLLAKIESSESSNRLEGIEVPHKKIESLVLYDNAPKNRSEQEIAGYRDVLNLIHESAKDIPFNVNIILQLHNTLYRYLSNPGGRFKTTDNEITEKKSDGTQRIRFSPVKAYLTPILMENLVKEYHFAIDHHLQDPLILIPLVIFDFLCIHPFSDGNGRMSRLLTLLLLYQFDYQVGRYISIERIFEESKEGYYETLEICSKHWHEAKHNVNPWLNYFWGVLIRAYREFEERVGKITTSRGSKTELIKNTVNRKITSFSIADIESDCPGVTRDMIRRVLRQMRDEGILSVSSGGRGALWKKCAK